MAFQFTKAVKSGAKLRMALVGPPGTGKTFTALKIATAMGGRIALIDTEHKSASKYADLFSFDTLQLDTYSPEVYVQAIRAAEKEGYDIIIIDSLTHAWTGKGGALSQVDAAAASSSSKNKYIAWKGVTPKWNELIETLLRCSAHLIGTMRAKSTYVMDQDKNGKMSPRKVGLGPIIRADTEFEFDVVGEMNAEHQMAVTKTRCHHLDGAIIDQPGADVAEVLTEWLNGEPLPQVVEIDAIGISVQGEDEWFQTGRAASARKFSNNATTSIEQLSAQEADRLLGALQARQAEIETESTKKEKGK